MSQQNNQSTEALLEERVKTHGRYEDHASCTQRTLELWMGEKNWSILTREQRETLHMIAHKVGRILTGDPNHPDHYDDIAGYAKLISQALAEGRKAVRPEARPNQPMFQVLSQEAVLVNPQNETKPSNPRLEEVIRDRGKQLPEKRDTYEVPPGWEGVRDRDGKAMGILRHKATDIMVRVVDLIPWDFVRMKSNPNWIPYRGRVGNLGPGTPEDGGHHARQEDDGA